MVTASLGLTLTGVDTEFKVATINWGSVDATGTARSPTLAIALALQNLADLLKQEARDQARLFHE